jgi:uncharacterized membrane protein HdeD (DUF308 family)
VDAPHPRRADAGLRGRRPGVPGIELLVLVYVFGTYAVLEGLAAVSFGIRARRSEPHGGWSVAQGVISLLAELVALVWPGPTAVTLLFLIAVWTVVLGVTEIGEAFAARRRGDDSWGRMLGAAALNIIVGVLLLVWPGSGILTLLWLVGAFAPASGVVGIGRALRVRATTGPTRVAAER